MSRTLPYDAFHRALVARLVADDVADGRVYAADAVPLGPAFPYVTVQMVDAVPADSKTTEAHEVRFALAVRTRSDAGHGSPAEAYALAQDVVTSLTRAAFDLSGDGLHVVVPRPPTTSGPDAYPSASGTHQHRDVTVTALYLIQTLP